MVETKSRFKEFITNRKPVLENGRPRQGQQFITFTNKFGYKKISAILNWKDGFLHSLPDIPAVQFEDTHTEYWNNGKLHNDSLDSNGNRMPAIFTDYGETKEYWVDGNRIK